MAVITIPYKPRTWSKTLHDAVTRWIVLVLHRRAGKSTAILNHLQRDCLRTPKQNNELQAPQFAFIGPTYKQTKRIAWEILKSIARPIPGTIPNEAELIMKYPNGARLLLAGSENVDSLRGLALWGGAQDESSQQPSNLFSEVISKALADHLGYWIWAGTPKGKNQFYRTYQTALANHKDYTTVFRTIDDSLRDEEGETIQNLRVALEDDRKMVAIGEMSEDEFQQEWYCNFTAAIKGAYYAKQIAKAREDKRITKVPYDPILPVYDVWDLGTGPRLAVGMYQCVGREVHMIDYEEGSESDGIPQMVQTLQRKPYVFGTHFAPHDIRATEIGSGKTRQEIADALGWHFEVVPQMGLDNGIEQGRLMFARLYVDEEKCAAWLDAISQYRQEWDENRGMFLEKPVHDFSSHPADVHRYASLVTDQMVSGYSNTRVVHVDYSV